MTSTTTVMKEMKDQMVALAEKVEEFQHNQTLINRGLKCEEDNTMGPGNSEALTESTHGASGSGLCWPTQSTKRGMSVLACQIVIASNAQN